MEIVPVHVVPAAALAADGTTETVRACPIDDSCPLLGETWSQPWPQLLGAAKALKVPLPLMVIVCAGGATPPGVATLNVNVPVPLLGVVLTVKCTFSVAARPSEVVTCTVPVYVAGTERFTTAGL